MTPVILTVVFVADTKGGTLAHNFPHDPHRYCGTRLLPDQAVFCPCGRVIWVGTTAGAAKT